MHMITLTSCNLPRVHCVAATCAATTAHLHTAGFGHGKAGRRPPRPIHKYHYGPALRVGDWVERACASVHTQHDNI